MLYEFVIFSPVFTCLFWMVIFHKMSFRTSAFRFLMLLAGVATLFFFSDACYASSHTPQLVLVISGLIGQIAAPAMIPMAWMYLTRLRDSQPVKPEQMLWIVFPAMLGTSAVLLTLLSGTDSIVRLQEALYAGGLSRVRQTTGDILLSTFAFSTVVLFRGVVLGEMLVYGVKSALLMRRENYRLRHLYKLRRGDHLRVSEMMFFASMLVAFCLLPKAFLLHAVLMENPWISALLAVLATTSLFLFCYMALFGAKRSLSRQEMRNAFRYNYDASCKDEIVGQMLSDLMKDAGEESLRRVREKVGLPSPEELSASEGDQLPGTVAHGIFSAVAKSWDDDSLLSRFEALMLQDQVYLEPGLTLAGVAERLHSNKTYVSRLVNNTYNLAFPDLVNTLRVDFAQRYIVAHRNAKQQEIASACGFTSASSFNNVFKKVVGMTPKVWLATRDRQAAGDSQSPAAPGSQSVSP